MAAQAVIGSGSVGLALWALPCQRMLGINAMAGRLQISVRVALSWQAAWCLRNGKGGWALGYGPFAVWVATK